MKPGFSTLREQAATPGSHSYVRDAWGNDASREGTTMPRVRPLSDLLRRTAPGSLDGSPAIRKAKNRGPLQAVPVMARAIADRLV